MKLYSEFKQGVLKTAVKSLFLLACSMLCGTASAGLINADFTGGLNGWSGDVNYYDVADNQEVSAFDVDFTAFADNYVSGINSVTLNTSANASMEFWGIYLFQAFVVEDNTSLISLAFDSIADSAYVTLVDDKGDLIHDFMRDGLRADVSALAGASVALEFGIEDFNFEYDDYLTVSNISIEQRTNTVSSPAAMALFLLGLMAIRQTSRADKKTH